ncbi:MAG: 50S ribosomal protein L10 [Gemmatimonadetes bacterium]|nr:50S ribosomal protein L10 [Gemmatimonadota bacterium]
MKRAVKEQFVTDLQERIDPSTTLYLTDFSGLDVASMTELRRNLRATGATFVVVKNRLAQRALAELDVPDLTSFLKGPTGVVISPTDAVEPARALTEFAKTHNDRPVFKVGIVEGTVVDAAAISRIATLPSREQLLSELAGAFQAPMAAFVGVLEALTRELAGLFEALKETKE